MIIGEIKMINLRHKEHHGKLLTISSVTAVISHNNSLSTTTISNSKVGIIGILIEMKAQ
jgi:hypothetical protein